MLSTQNKNEVMGCFSISLLVLTWLLSLADKAVMAPNLDSFGRDRAAYQEHGRQRRIAEREARRYKAHSFSKTCFQDLQAFFVACFQARGRAAVVPVGCVCCACIRLQNAKNSQLRLAFCIFVHKNAALIVTRFVKRRFAMQKILRFDIEGVMLVPSWFQFITNAVLGSNFLPLCLWLAAELGGDKLESRMERGLSIKKAYHLMMRKPLLTSPASIWREVHN